MGVIQELRLEGRRPPRGPGGRRRARSRPLRGAGLLLGLALVAPVDLPAQTRASLQQVKEAWLAADAVVVGEYEGPDAASGDAYHRIDAEEVWLGTPARGPVLFKAPRGIQADPGDDVLLFLWDQLNGSTHAFLEKSRRLYGEDLWATIGPDSVTPYLLPFSRFAFLIEDDRIDLRGTNVFGDPMRKRDLRKEMDVFERGLTPSAQFQHADVVVEARVEERQDNIYQVEDVPVEHRVLVRFHTGTVHKGELEESFSFEYPSFPRSPRFEEGEDVLLFLSARGDSWFLPYGKRSVYHVDAGQVLETSQPLREFLKAMQGS